MNILSTYFRALVLIALFTVPSLAMAVTQKEMEQARTIATQTYLRYANNGSGYLDEVKPAPTTMAELEAVLKTKEKENIKAFKAIPVPSDYASWDKDKLVEYWSVTAFKTPGLIEAGKVGRSKAAKLIKAMTVTAPQAASASAPAASSPSPESGKASTPETLAQADSIAEAEINATADQMEEDAELAEEKESDHTWVYVMVLCILVAIVVGLVVYAASVFKRNGGDKNSGLRRDEREEEDNENIERLETLLADKDMEIGMLKKKLDSASKQNSELKAKLDSLSAEIAILRGAGASRKEQEKKGEETLLAEKRGSQKGTLRAIYLGRANARGIFVRADKTLNPGHSIFVLETNDGFSGSFRVANSPEAWDLALSDPREYLTAACSGPDLEDTDDVTRIVNEASGTAVFEGGCWKVIRKAKIRYE